MSGYDAPPPSRGAIAASAQDLSDAEYGELGDLLAAIPEPLDPLDPVMLDGYLCGVIVQPELVADDAWLRFVWDAQGHRWGEAEPGPEQLRARALILRRYVALNRSLAEFGSFDPFVLELGPDDGPAEAEPGAPVDAIGETIGPWVAGFAQAVELFPALGKLRDRAVDVALARVLRFMPAAGAATPAVSLEAAIAEVVAAVAALYAATEPLRYHVDAVRRAAPKVGRNDPCPCGSGRKFKQCHGAAGRPEPA